MKANQLATLVLRLLGIYMVVVGIPAISTTVTVANNAHFTGDASPAYSSLMLVSLRIFVGILLIAFSGSLGQKITPEGPLEEKISPISFEHAQAIAFASVGVLIFADALPSLFNSIFYLLTMFYSNGSVFGYSVPVYRYTFQAWPILGPLIKAVVGLWLFFRANSVSHIWRSLQNFDPPQPPPTP